MNAPSFPTASPKAHHASARANSLGDAAENPTGGATKDFLSHNNKTTRDHILIVLRRRDLSRAARRGAMDHQGVFEHFAMRARQRMPAGTSVFGLWDFLITEISADVDPEKVRFCCAAKARWRQIWRFQLNGQWHYAVWDIRICLPITILLGVGKVARRGKRKFKQLNGET